MITELFERTFTCATCGETFHKSAPYNAHIRTAHQQLVAATRKRTAQKTTDAPSAKRRKRSDQASTSTASEPASKASAENFAASWQPDPILIPANLVPASEENITQTYRQHWPQIRTRFSRQNRLQDWYNFRLSSISPASFREQLNRIFADQSTVFKVNFSFGFILRNTETGALQYHHPSANNNLVLEQPFLISSPDDLERLYQQIAEIDFLEWVRQQRPNSKWVVDLVTNVTWFVWKIRDHPIGRGKYLPGYIVDNTGITPLDRDIRRGKPYEDHLCFFSCLTLHNGCHTRNLERDTQYYYQQYRGAGLGKKKFHGVKLSELDDLEKLYEVNIQVYSLAPTQSHSEDEDNEENTPEIAATLLRRSHRHYSSTLYLNLYENHFSYIKDLARYSKSFCCSRCGKNWKRTSNLRQHEATCDGKVKEDEETESENEEDRAFLDDEIQEQEDVSFYRRFHVELDRGIRQERRQQRQELAMNEDTLFGQEQTSDNKVLNELAEKLKEYLRELPLLGFNSGKYDLNAVKEFLFPYLIETQPITFSVKRNSNHMCINTDFLKLLDISNYVAPRSVSKSV